MKLIFALVGIALFLAAIMMGGSITMFVNLPSVLIVIGGTITFSLAHHSSSEVGEALKAAFGTEEVSAENAGKHLAVFATLRVLVYGSGVTGVLIGLIQMLHNLDDPSLIGPAMAVALLCSLYSVLLAEFGVAPLASRVLVRAENQPPRSMTGAQSGAVSLGFVGVAILMMIVLLVVFP